MYYNLTVSWDVLYADTRMKAYSSVVSDDRKTRNRTVNALSAYEC